MKQKRKTKTIGLGSGLSSLLGEEVEKKFPEDDPPKTTRELNAFLAEKKLEALANAEDKLKSLKAL